MLSKIRSLWEWWKRVGRRIGDFQARLILTVLYFVVVAPFALIVRFAADPLSIKGGPHKGWLGRIDGLETPMISARRQF